MKYMMPPNGTEDGTYHWIRERYEGTIHIGLYTDNGWFNAGWTIPGFLYDISPIPLDIWEYLKPVVPYNATP